MIHAYLFVTNNDRVSSRLQYLDLLHSLLPSFCEFSPFNLCSHLVVVLYVVCSVRQSRPDYLLYFVFILSRLDYCNAILARLPVSTLAPLQRVLHAAARVVCDLKPRDHISEAVRALHWLPIQQRIDFKLCLLVHHTVMEELHLISMTLSHRPLQFLVGQHFVPLFIMI